MAFYNHTITSVKEARQELTKLGVPTSRPLDFFCENIKTDSHMAKVLKKKQNYFFFFHPYVFSIIIDLLLFFN